MFNIIMYRLLLSRPTLCARVVRALWRVCVREFRTRAVRAIVTMRFRRIRMRFGQVRFRLRFAELLLLNLPL